MAQRLNGNSEQYFQTRYPWDEWTDGSGWEVRQGIDFNCTPASFVSNMYTLAKNRGLCVRVRKNDAEGIVHFQFYRAKLESV